MITKDEIKGILGKECDNTLVNKVYRKLNRRIERNFRFSFIDLFSGIGGIRMAFDTQHGECVFSSEWDKNSQITYYCNYGEIPKGDINEINAEEIPEHNILLAGFPCQAFSIAGYQRGFEDTRGTLFFNIANIIEHHLPDAFLLENVKGLVSHNEGKTYLRILEILRGFGYRVEGKILNSYTHANIPQTRERVIIVGIREDLYREPFKFPNKMRLRRTINDLIDNNEQSDKYYYQPGHQYYQELNNDVRSRETIYQWRRHYVRENKSNACPTLTANMGTGGHNVPIIRDDYGIRKLTPRECARFQGFSDSFILPTNLPDSKLYYQIGNSVTVPLIRRVARLLINYLGY